MRYRITFSAQSLKAEGKPGKVFCRCRCDAGQESMSSGVVLLSYLPRSNPVGMAVEVPAWESWGRQSPRTSPCYCWYRSLPGACSCPSCPLPLETALLLGSRFSPRIQQKAGPATWVPLRWGKRSCLWPSCWADGGRRRAGTWEREEDPFWSKWAVMSHFTQQKTVQECVSGSNPHWQLRSSSPSPRPRAGSARAFPSQQTSVRAVTESRRGGCSPSSLPAVQTLSDVRSHGRRVVSGSERLVRCTVGESSASAVVASSKCVVRCLSSVTEVCSPFLSLLAPTFPKVYYCSLVLLSCALLPTCFTLVLEEAGVWRTE